MKVRINNRVMRNGNIGIRAKAVYGYLCIFSDDNGNMNVSLSEMFEDLGIPKEGGEKYIKELVDNHCLTIEPSINIDLLCGRVL